jgi:hypothetical protein
MIRLFLVKMPLEKLEADGLTVKGDHAAMLALQDAIETPSPEIAYDAQTKASIWKFRLDTFRTKI